MWIEYEPRQRVIEGQKVDDVQLNIQVASPEEVAALASVLADPSLWSDRFRGSACLRLRAHLRPEAMEKLKQAFPGVVIF